MNDTTKLLRLVVPLAVVGVGIGGAVLLGRSHEQRSATLPAGTEIVGALTHAISTEQSGVGDPVELRTVEPIALNDDVIAEGATLRGTVTHVKGGGRIAGAPELAVQFTDLVVDGQTYSISASTFQVKGNDDAKKSALEIGGGAVVGGVLKGVKGAVVGAAIGTGVAVATKGDQLTLASGQHVRVRLTQPVTVQYRPHTTDKATP